MLLNNDYSVEIIFETVSSFKMFIFEPEVKFLNKKSDINQNNSKKAPCLLCLIHR